MGIIFSQAEPGITFYATPSYILRELQLDNGGEQSRLLREALERLGLVRYVNDAFFDPITKEHRRVICGFLSLSLPISLDTARGWRISVDPEFFRMCEVAGGFLRFDLAVFRELSKASRRLFLFLKKLFYKPSVRTRQFDARHIAVDVLGYPATMRGGAKRHNERVKAAAAELIRCGILSGFENSKRGKGSFRVTFERGPHFDERPEPRKPLAAERHALYEPLHNTIGLGDGHIRSVMSKYKHGLIQEWCEITIAKLERFGPKDFSNSPAAYFMDSIKKAAEGTRTPPDWWHEMLTEERCKTATVAQEHLGIVRKDNQLGAPEDLFIDFLRTDGRAEFERLAGGMFQLFRDAGQSEQSASDQAAEHARKRLRVDFEKSRANAPTRPGVVIDLEKVKQLNKMTM